LYYYYYAAFKAPCVGHKDDESQALMTGRGAQSTCLYGQYGQFLKRQQAGLTNNPLRWHSAPAQRAAAANGQEQK